MDRLAPGDYRISRRWLAREWRGPWAYPLMTLAIPVAVADDTPLVLLLGPSVLLEAAGP